MPLITLAMVFYLFLIAEVCRARLWIPQAATYYKVAFALSAYGAIFF
jgi:hypothetical protein